MGEEDVKAIGESLDQPRRLLCIPERKDARVELRVTKSEKEMMKKLAGRCNVSVSCLVTTAVKFLNMKLRGLPDD